MIADLFTTRETASAIWLALLLGWGLTYSSVRSGLVSLLQTAFHWKILSVFLGFAIYTGGMIWILIWVGFWTLDLAKDSILWFFFVGIVLVFRLVTEKSESSIWSRVATDQVKVIIVFEYLVGTYTFALAWELILQPVIAGIVILNAYTQTREEHASVARFLSRIQSLLGLAVLLTAALRAFGDHTGTNAIRSIVLAPLLSLLSVPAFYGLVLVTAYERLFVLQRIGPTKSWRFKWYTRLRLIRKLGFSPHRIVRFQGRFGLQLTRVTTKEEVDSLLAQANAS